MNHKLLITGGLGYIGTLLVEACVLDERVSEILVIDKDSASQRAHAVINPKVKYIHANLSDSTWQSQAQNFSPDIIIHTAWQIRELYGKQKIQERWNIDGSDNVFDFAFTSPSVKTLIHFSTVASYGAYSTNTFEHRFTENEPLRKTNYRYAEEKGIVEEHLEKKYNEKKNKQTTPRVFVVRPASITGPRARSLHERFGLQSALSGTFKKTSVFHSLVSFFLSRIPLTKKWCRQFVHENDIVNSVLLLAFYDTKQESYEIFNLCPPGPITKGEDMARALNKKTLYLPAWIIRFAFFILWHISHGKIPTSRGGWKSYAYPIVVDGSKITREFGYTYQYNSIDAFTKENK